MQAVAAVAQEDAKRHGAEADAARLGAVGAHRVGRQLGEALNLGRELLLKRSIAFVGEGVCHPDAADVLASCLRSSRHGLSFMVNTSPPAAAPALQLYERVHDTARSIGASGDGGGGQLHISH